MSCARSAAESAIVLLAERLVDLLLHEPAQLVLVDVVVGELRADLVDDELVDAQAQLLELSPRGVDARLLLQVLPAGVLLRHGCDLLFAIGASRGDAARLAPRARR